MKYFLMFFMCCNAQAFYFNSPGEYLFNRGFTETVCVDKKDVAKNLHGKFNFQNQDREKRYGFSLSDCKSSIVEGRFGGAAEVIRHQSNPLNLADNMNYKLTELDYDDLKFTSSGGDNTAFDTFLLPLWRVLISGKPAPSPAPTCVGSLGIMYGHKSIDFSSPVFENKKEKACIQAVKDWVRGQN